MQNKGTCHYTEINDFVITNSGVYASYLQIAIHTNQLVLTISLKFFEKHC